jgi:predicted nucleotide-binding protein (sugar kinase/HSP70/actin superfamily)
MSSAGLRHPDAGETARNPAASTPASPPKQSTPSAIPRKHYKRPDERPFIASERDSTTILIGGLTWKHEQFIRAVFQGCGYKCEVLPTPDQVAFHVGKEYGNNGQCSPAYFTSGSLIQFLKNLEAGGLSRSEIIDRYIFFTAGSCGPCRFGMYAAEYRMALQNAGFDGFRIIRFQQDQGVNQKAQQPGLKYTIDFGLGMLKTLYLADALNDITHNVRPYEVNPGETNRVMDQCLEDLCEHLRTYKSPEVLDRMSPWLAGTIAKRNALKITLNVIYKFRQHLYGQAFMGVLERCRNRINGIEVDRTRVKPLVKIIGEFLAQTTEGDGNYRMFEFLEREGAHVQPEAIGTWIAYLLFHARLQMNPRRGMDSQCREPAPGDRRQRIMNELNFQKKRSLLWFGEWIYKRFYYHVIDEFGGTAHRLVNQDEMAELAEPFYKTLARGGEGYLEIGKNIYYTINKLCHMVLSLKPFGCMPSSMSDGIQSAVISRYADMTYLPIETSGEGEVNAHSRVQMALGDAKAKAKNEYSEALASTGKSIEEIRAFVNSHPELSKPFYRIPHHRSVAGVAANFVLHVNELMTEKA